MSGDDEIDTRLRGEYPAQRRNRDKRERDDESATPDSRMEPRFMSFFQWLSGIAAVLIALGIGWIASISVSTASDVKVLLARPEPVPMEQYKSDQSQLQRQLETMQKQLDKLKP